MNNPYLSGDEKAKRLNAMRQALYEKVPINRSLQEDVNRSRLNAVNDYIND